MTNPTSLEFSIAKVQGELYRAYIQLTGSSGLSRRIRTVWIVLYNEDVAGFVTAVPDRLGGLQ